MFWISLFTVDSGLWQRLGFDANPSPEPISQWRGVSGSSASKITTTQLQVFFLIFHLLPHLPPQFSWLESSSIVEELSLGLLAGGRQAPAFAFSAIIPSEVSKPEPGRAVFWLSTMRSTLETLLSHPALQGFFLPLPGKHPLILKKKKQSRFSNRPDDEEPRTAAYSLSSQSSCSPSPAGGGLLSRCALLTDSQECWKRWKMSGKATPAAKWTTHNHLTFSLATLSAKCCIILPTRWRTEKQVWGGADYITE